MSKTLQLVLNESNSKLYRTRPGTVKQARIRWQRAEYRLSWGIQEFHGPHVQVLAPGGDYGVDLHTFFATHQPLPDHEHHYIKVVKVRALCLIESITLLTRVNDSVEMSAAVPAGAFVVENPDGEQYAMSAEEFSCRYVADDEC